MDDLLSDQSMRHVIKLVFEPGRSFLAQIHFTQNEKYSSTLCSSSPLATRPPGGVAEEQQGEEPTGCSLHSNCARLRGEAVSVAHEFGAAGHIWTALSCCCWKDPPLFLLHFYFVLVVWIQLWCSPSTLTPVMLSGKVESRGPCSGFLSPCTGSSTQIKECKLCLQP